MRKLTLSLSLAFLTLMILLSIILPAIIPSIYFDQNISERLQAPSLHHWMGTDALGRDLLIRILWGAQISLTVSTLSVLLAFLMGGTLGALAGLKEGWLDQIISQVADLFSIFPATLLAILITLLFGRGVSGLILALAITSWVTPARLVRTQVIQQKKLTYIESAQALGLSPLSIFKNHMVPNLLGSVGIALTHQLPANLMSESFLSFLGLGVQPPLSSWGSLAHEGFQLMETHPHLLFFPSLTLILTSMALGRFSRALEKS